MIARYRKALAALAAGAAVVVASGLLTGNVGVWLSTAVAALTAALGVAAAPANKPKG